MIKTVCAGGGQRLLCVRARAHVYNNPQSSAADRRRRRRRRHTFRLRKVCKKKLVHDSTRLQNERRASSADVTTDTIEQHKYCCSFPNRKRPIFFFICTHRLLAKLEKLQSMSLRTDVTVSRGVSTWCLYTNTFARSRICFVAYEFNETMRFPMF